MNRWWKRKAAHRQSTQQPRVLEARVETISLEYINAVMSQNYRPTFDLRLLEAAPRRSLCQGGSFRVEMAVTKSEKTSTGNIVVIKRPLLAQQDVGRNPKWKDIRLEVEALLHPPIASCKHIIDLLAIGWEDDHEDPEHVQPSLIMPFAIGTLEGLVRDRDPGPDLKLKMSLDVACGLKVLHSCGIVHGDLKSENVLIFLEEDGENGDVVAKLNDFGCSINNSHHFQSFAAGTPPWTSPEWRDEISKDILPQSDVYAFGLLLWRIMLRNLSPFGKLQSFREASKLTDAAVEKLKKSPDDKFLNELKVSLKPCGHVNGPLKEDELERMAWLGYSWPVFEILEAVLDNSVRREPKHRSLENCIQSLLVVDIDAGQSRMSKLNTLGEVSYMFEPQIKIDHEAISKLPWEVQQTLFRHHSLNVNASDTEGSSNKEKVIESSMWLFICYLQGIGVDANNELAHQHLLNAARLGGPVAKALYYRSSMVLRSTIVPKSSPATDIKTIVNWLARSIELGCFGAQDDLSHLLLSNPDQEALISKAILISLYRLRCYTAGVGTNFFLDGNGHRLNPLQIDSKVAFEKELGAKIADKSFNVNTMCINSRGDTLLHLAATCGFEDAVEMLFEMLGSALDVHVLNREEETPILSASRAGQSGTVRILLNHGADLRPSALGESPLHWLSAFPGNIKVLAHSEWWEEDNRLANLHQLASSAIYSHYWGSELPSGTPLHRAVHFKKLEVVQTLLDLGADPLKPGIGENKESALQLACIRHYSEIVKIMLDHLGIQDVQKLPGTIPLRHFVFYRDNKVLSLSHGGIDSVGDKDFEFTMNVLLERGAGAGDAVYDKDGKGAKTTTLCQAVEANSLRYVRVALKAQLLQSKTILDMGFGDPARNPLNIAIENGSLAIVQALLEAGADPRNPVDEHGKRAGLSALHSCALAESFTKRDTVLEIFDLLAPRFDSVDVGVSSVNFSHDVLESPFALAVRLGKFDIASALLERGADIDFMYSTTVSPVYNNMVVHQTLDEAYMDLSIMGDQPMHMTVLGAMLSDSSRMANCAIRFLLGYDKDGRKKKDWKHPIPSPIVSKHRQFTIWHAVAFKSSSLTIYEPEHIRERTRLLEESYGDLGRDFLEKTCQRDAHGDIRPTALQLAVQCNNAEVVNALLRLGADPKTEYLTGGSALDDAYELLVRDLELEDGFGWSVDAIKKQKERELHIFLMLGGDEGSLDTTEITCNLRKM